MYYERILKRWNGIKHPSFPGCRGEGGGEGGMGMVVLKNQLKKKIALTKLELSETFQVKLSNQ